MVKIRKLKKVKLTKNNHINPSQHNMIDQFKEAKKFKENIREKNPDFLEFTLKDFFIYETKFYFIYTKKINNLNLLKPSKDQISELINYNNDLNEILSNNDHSKTIKVIPEIRDLFLKMKPSPPILNKIDLNIKQILEEYQNNKNISLRKIREIYFNKYGNLISITKINRILKRKLNYHFLKTSVKTSVLQDKKYIIMSFFFLNIFLRGLKLGANFIFIDESGFDLLNTNFRVWRSREKDYFSKVGKKERLNLVMAVNNDRIIHYHLTNENTNSDNFLNFMNELYQNLNQNEKENSIFIMDNLTSHLTKPLFEFYYKKKLKVLFNVPYLSKFNMIEICFRTLKNITYKKIFANISELKNEIKNIIKGDYLNSLLNKLYKETLNNYINYINDNINLNLK